MRTADLIARCLQAEDVPYVFGLPGEETLDLLDAFAHAKLRFIPTRHEQGAAFMAGVWGRLTGRAGVAVATLGPGATNLVSGVADATLDRAPMIAITGQKPLEDMHKAAHQYVDSQALFVPITKWSQRIYGPGAVPEIMRKAFHVAEAELPGAVHLELPEDVAAAEASGRPLPRLAIKDGPAPPAALAEAADILARAGNPVILAGNGIIRGCASQALQRFAEAWNVPVTNTFMAKGVLPPEHPLYLGTVGLQAHDVTLCGLDRSDLIVTAGYDFIEYGPSLWNKGGRAGVLHIGATHGEVDVNYPARLELVGDLASTLEALAARSVGRPQRDWSALRAEIVRGLADLGPIEETQAGRLRPTAILAVLAQTLPEARVISDVGAHKMWIARHYPAHFPNQVLISNGFASMGIALPGAIASRLAEPERPVVAISGDGGFLMNCAELATATMLGLNLTVLVWNDDAYGLIRWKAETYGLEDTGTGLVNPDFVALAQAFGAHGMRVTSEDNLRSALRDAARQRGVTVIEVPVDYSDNMRLTRRLGQYVCRD